MGKAVKKLLGFILVVIVAIVAYNHAPVDVRTKVDGFISSTQEHLSAFNEDLKAQAAAASPQAASPDDYTVTATNPDGSPVRWNPCEPINYALNLTYAPEGAEGEVTEALNRISSATGLTFNFVGQTDQIPQQDWYAQSWPGMDYPPVLIAWADPSTSDMFLEDTDSGRATANPITVNGSARYVTGAAVFNTNHDHFYTPGFNGGVSRGGLIMHELGHVVGLGHAEGQSELMYPRLGAYTPETFSVGDLSGLNVLGSTQGCLS